HNMFYLWFIYSNSHYKEICSDFFIYYKYFYRYTCLNELYTCPSEVSSSTTVWISSSTTFGNLFSKLIHFLSTWLGFDRHVHEIVVTWNVIIVGHATHGYGLDAVMLVKIHEIVCCFLLLVNIIKHIQSEIDDRVHILFCAILGQENTDQSTSMERKITHTWSGKYRSALLRIQSNEFNQSTSMERKITHTWSGKYISALLRIQSNEFNFPIGII
ncbi:hypothetical protein ACJX0J_035677, partial [Zea mays]